MLLYHIWTKGVYCCDIKTGELRWNFRLKHARSVFAYSDYIVCNFDEIGLRKISYDGEELFKSPLPDCNRFFELEKPYVFCGPIRGKYLVIDTESMAAAGTVRFRDYWKADDRLIILDVKGTHDEILLEGWLNDERFERMVFPKP